MEHDYRNIIPHIDLDRSLDAIEYFSINGIDDAVINEFKSDIESGNDSIELHLVKSKSYKEALILKLKKNNGTFSQPWRDFLKDEQKTFGGSKIFYINDDCSKILVFSLANEITNKLNMAITRINKINEKISRLNSKIKKDNFDLYSLGLKDKEAPNKKKDDIINFINQNLRV